MRQIVVDHERQIGDIEPARGHVGSDQDRQFAFLELGHDIQPGRLQAVAVNGFNAKAIALEIARQLIGTLLGAAEHDDLRHGMRADQVCEQCFFLEALDRVQFLQDRLIGRILPRHLDGFRALEEIVRQLLDFRRESRREQQGLLAPGQQCHDAQDIGHEAHVQHAISLVEHQHFDRTQRHGLLLHMIQQAPRRCHQHFHPAAQDFHLIVHAHAAEYHG